MTKRRKLTTFQNIAGTWTAAYSGWEWETGETEAAAVQALKDAAQLRDERYGRQSEHV